MDEDLIMIAAVILAILSIIWAVMIINAVAAVPKILKELENVRIALENQNSNKADENDIQELNQTTSNDPVEAWDNGSVGRKRLPDMKVEKSQISEIKKPTKQMHSIHLSGNDKQGQVDKNGEIFMSLGFILILFVVVFLIIIYV